MSLLNSLSVKSVRSFGPMYIVSGTLLFVGGIVILAMNLYAAEHPGTDNNPSPINATLMNTMWNGFFAISSASLSIETIAWDLQAEVKTDDNVSTLCIVLTVLTMALVVASFTQSVLDASNDVILPAVQGAGQALPIIVALFLAFQVRGRMQKKRAERAKV